MQEEYERLVTGVLIPLFKADQSRESPVPGIARVTCKTSQALFIITWFLSPLITPLCFLALALAIFFHRIVFFVIRVEGVALNKFSSIIFLKRKNALPTYKILL